jgi:hypothetical protein
MNTYELVVTMTVKVEAPDDSDAVELVDEALGEGDYAGYEVTAMNIHGIKEV